MLPQIYQTEREHWLKFIQQRGDIASKFIQCKGEVAPPIHQTQRGYCFNLSNTKGTQSPLY